VQRRKIAALAVTGVALAGAAAFGIVQAGTASAATLSGRWYASAPYLMPFDNSPPDAVAVMNATGQKAFQLAFILAPNGGGCSPTWDGTRAVSSDTEAGDLIGRIRANGGDVSVSIGGYGGTKLGQTCGTPEATAAAYQQVITKYALKAIDFDLEMPEYENTAAIHNEIGAAKILQANNPGLYLSITTASSTAGEGTGWFGKQMLIEAKNAGLTPDNFSIMPFDGGFEAGASAQIAALEGMHGTLMKIFGWDSGTAYSRLGVSLMNGRSDTGEYFRQADFESVLDYAISHKLARMTNWSVNRDRQCADPNQSTTSGICSSVQQNLYDFTKFSARFAGATPPTGVPTTPTTGSTTPPPPTGGTPPPTPTAGVCPPPWSASAVYTSGNLVSHKNTRWSAQWWTQGETPGAAGVWVNKGTCTGGGIDPTPTTATPSPSESTPQPTPGTCTQEPWSASKVYTQGMTVGYAGHVYTAQWWTQNEKPGAAGVWLDKGAC
jgi:chitinase